MLVIKQRVATKRRIAIVALFGAAVVLGAGLLMYFTEGEDVAESMVLKLDARGRQVVWSPDGKILAVVMIYEPLIFGKKERALQLWDLEQGEESAPLARSTLKGWFGSVVFSPDGKTIAATVTEGPRRVGDTLMIESGVKYWDANTLALKQTLGSGGQSHPQCIAFSPDGKLLAAGDPGSKSVELRNAETGSLERTLDTGEAQPWSLVFSPDGKTLVVGGLKDDRTLESFKDVNLVSGEIQWWDTQTWTLKRVVKQDKDASTVAFSADGKLLASGGLGHVVQLWDAETGVLIHSLQGLSSGTRSVAISPDSQTVAAGGKDGKIRLWDVQTGKLKAVLKGRGWGLFGGSEIYSVAFSPDGKTLASASQDQTVRLWKMPAWASGNP
jgi:WD40 repeat protein